MRKMEKLAEKAGAGRGGAQTGRGGGGRGRGGRGGGGDGRGGGGPRTSTSSMGTQRWQNNKNVCFNHSKKVIKIYAGRD